MRPIVHIGYHKTATTWFQQSVYPASASHYALERKAIRAALIYPSAYEFDPVAARHALASPDGRPVLLCEEGLSGYLHNGGLNGHLSRTVAERIHATFPDARIVISVRAQPAMIAAVYQQYVRGGGTYLPHRYLFPDQYLRGAFAESHRVPRFSFDHFAYDRLVAHYDALFGAENVHVLLHEQLCAEPAVALQRLCAATGLCLGDAVPPAERRNASYALPLVWLALLLNHFTRRTVLDKRTLIHIPGWYWLRRALLESLNRTGWFGRSPSAETLLGPQIAAHIRDRFQASNRRLRAIRPELPLERFGYPLVPGAVPDRARPLWALVEQPIL
ncbi:sulfotransferase [Sphingomonas jatrophae]|uniref:Sulfotransferase family protein n=1 Tax=Sphingomonas jatrophae TaxID=1166337 RepID=A0A1I6JZL7_9SPHN|nr:sulfotransferase [Sphingomonas jatrophae]SFR84403.1 Sulfotransferase family protein [Sphingomonas jatrophae]